MIRLFVFSLLAIIVALWISLTYGFPQEPGYLLIAFGNYTLETNLVAFLVAMMFLLVGLILLYGLYRWGSNALGTVRPSAIRDIGRAYSEKLKAGRRSNTLEGMLYFTRGNWQASYNLLMKGIDDDDASVVNYLAAAYAAYELSDRDSWMQCLEKAETEYPSARSTINSLKAQLLFRTDQLEQCVAVLEQLKMNSINDGFLLRMLKDVYVRLNDWSKLKELLPLLTKKKIINQEELEQLQMRVLSEELTAASVKPKDASGQDLAKSELLKLWKKAPARFKEDEQVVTHYVELLVSLGDKATAAKALETAITRNWNEKLVVSYGEQEFENSQKQLLVAEGWLKGRPANANLLLALGRISMRNQLWGKAREYFEASVRITPSAEAYGELSRLTKHLGEDEASESYLKSYGDMVGVDLPELPMPEVPKLTH